MLNSIKATIKQDRLRIKTQPNPQDLSYDKSYAAEISNLENEINRLKKWIESQAKYKKQQKQYENVAKQIESYEKELKSIKRQAIIENLHRIQARKSQRILRNRQAQQSLLKLKKQSLSKKRKIQTLVSQYEQEYKNIYKLKLNQRRNLMSINFQDIKRHEQGYIKSRNYQRKKSITYNNDESHERKHMTISPELLYSKDEIKKQLEVKRQKITQLINRRKQYGYAAERQAKKIRIQKSLLQKIEEDKEKLSKSQFIPIPKQIKPRLNTNFKGVIDKQKQEQIKKIVVEKNLTASDKLIKMGNLIERYETKYKVGDVEALDKICAASIARADLFLNHS